MCSQKETIKETESNFIPLPLSEIQLLSIIKKSFKGLSPEFLQKLDNMLFTGELSLMNEVDTKKIFFKYDNKLFFFNSKKLLEECDVYKLCHLFYNNFIDSFLFAYSYKPLIIERNRNKIKALSITISNMYKEYNNILKNSYSLSPSMFSN